MSEKEFKEVGEELARLAVEYGLAVGQLRQLYRDVRTKPLPMVQAIVMRQIGRALGGDRERTLRGYDVVGKRFLELLEEYDSRKNDLERILWYANMMYPYYESENKDTPRTPVGRTARQATTGIPQGGLSASVEKDLREITRKTCTRYGVGDIKVSPEGGGFLVNVVLRRFQGNPRDLSQQLYDETISNLPMLSGRVRFWIDRR